MNNWNKLLIYELLLLNGNTIPERLGARIEKFKQEGNVLDESISPEIAAQRIKTWHDNIIEQERLKKQKQLDENLSNMRDRWRKLAEEIPLKPKPEIIPTLDWQLGYFVGEIIVVKKLPSLSIDNNTLTVINVSDEETAEYNRLDEAIVKEGKIDGESKEWKDYQAYRSFLKDKYLPKELVCYVNKVYLPSEDLSEFKKGLGSALWNSDVSYYSSKEEDIDVKVDGFSTTIKLKL